MKLLVLLSALTAAILNAHDAHGRADAPPEARRLKNPVRVSEPGIRAARDRYHALCSNCHGEDGKARTKVAGAMTFRPTDLTEYVMESMKDGEIFWVIGNGIQDRMPAFSRLAESERWELVNYVRQLRELQRAYEKSKLGPYEWRLPPGFPFPNVPADNPMTAEKVELGRYLFYDRRLSLNRTQSCATCHQQRFAFADTRARGLGSTGQLHPRGPMSLVNVAYAPVLTWGNPNVRSLEQQALVPMFGDAPVELGLSGKEDVLLKRLKADPHYAKMFKTAFPADTDPFTIGNVTKAIASFERTIMSGDSPYDVYQRGDDPNAISPSAKRGEALFFSERLECFHCHGGFNFTGALDYFGKGFTEIEFHNTGLYNLKGKHSYPAPNYGIYEFTGNEDDVGKFKAPTLRNIAVTAPYMHDGSVPTLEAAIDHYSAGGRTIQTGPNAGVGFNNPNKSEFIKSFDLAPGEKADLLAFLRSLTDRSLLTNPRYSDPNLPPPRRTSSAPSKYTLNGTVVHVYPSDGAIALYHKEVPGFMNAMEAPYAMEFAVPDRQSLANLKPGMKITAGVRKQGSDYILDHIRPAAR